MDKNTLLVFLIAGILVFGLLYVESISGNAAARRFSTPAAPYGGGGSGAGSETAGSGGGGTGGGTASGTNTGSSPSPSIPTTPTPSKPVITTVPSSGKVTWKDMSNVQQKTGINANCNTVCSNKCIIGQDIASSTVITCSTTKQKVLCICAK